MKERLKEASLYEKLEDGSVKCRLCSQACTIPEGKRGFCMVRENRGGKLYSLVYGKLPAAHIDPIEKKPLYHFLPGSRSYSIATVGCNFRCTFCQNWDISQMPRDKGGLIVGDDWEPEDVVKEAKKNKCASISYTYTEPTIFFEFARDVGKKAKREGIKSVYVTNGFMTREAIDAMAPWLSVANVDIKAFTNNFYRKICGGRLQPVLDACKYMKKKGIWVEITTLIIPGKNDSDEELKGIAGFIAKELDVDTPWHLSAFHPDYKMLDVGSTPAKTLLKARKIGEKAGLHYIYIGNIQGEGLGDTHCPKCGEIVIKRAYMELLENRLRNGKCPKCGEEIAGVWS